MNNQLSNLTQQAAWKALAVAQQTKSRNCICGSCSPRTPKRGERMTAEAAGLFLDYSKNRITDQTLKLLLQLAKESGLRATDRCHVQRRENQRHGKPRRPARRLARAQGRDPSSWTARMSCPRSTPCSDKMAGFVQPRPQRRMEGPHRQTHPQRHQHRHRRFRPRPGDGL